VGSGPAARPPLAGHRLAEERQIWGQDGRHAPSLVPDLRLSTRGSFSVEPLLAPPTQDSTGRAPLILEGVACLDPHQGLGHRINEVGMIVDVVVARAR